MQLLQIVLVAGLGYLLGSIPTGLLLARLNGVDLLAKGSGKTGATNTMNAVGPAAAAAVLVVDLVKGVLAALLAYIFSWSGMGWLAAAVTLAGGAVIVGHNYSLGVRLLSGKWGGGRGIVPAFGAMLVLHPLVVLGAVVVGLLAIVLTRLVAVGAIAGTIGAVVVAVILVANGSLSSWFLPAVFAWAGLVTMGFADNIERLLRGAEPKLGRPR